MSFSPLHSLIDSPHVSLKVCGVTRGEDAVALEVMGIEALGVNFWEKSKRYCSPDKASLWLSPLAGKIIRVGVFVNESPEKVKRLIDDQVIDIAQFHGDESRDYCLDFAREAYPFIKAFGVKNARSLRQVKDYHADAVLLDAPAPGEYGGTGSVFDWNLADMFVRRQKHLHVFLAGGITTENAYQAAEKVRPAFIDVASGSESMPGIKDLEKCRLIHEAVSGVLRKRDLPEKGALDILSF